MGRQKIYNAEFRCNRCNFHLEMRGTEDRLNKISKLLAIEHKEYSPSCDAEVKDFSAKIIVKDNRYLIEAKELLIKRREETESLLKSKDYHLKKIIGNENVKEILKRRLVDYIKYKERLQKIKKYPSSGLLLAGIQGTGKSDIVCAAANDIIMSSEENRERFDVIILKCHDFMSGTVGESGKKVEAILDAIRESNRDLEKEAILIIDEVDNLAPDRNTRSVLTSERTGSLLDEFGGIHDDHTIFLMGTTNKPDKIDSEAIVAGRFGMPVLVNVPTKEERFQMFKMFTENIVLSEDITIDFINETIGNFTGRDIYSFTNDLHTVSYVKEDNGEHNSPVIITREDIKKLAYSSNYKNINKKNMNDMMLLAEYYSRYEDKSEGKVSGNVVKDIEFDITKK